MNMPRDDAVLLQKKLLHLLRAVAKHAGNPVREGLWSCNDNGHECVLKMALCNGLSSLTSSHESKELTGGASLTQLPQLSGHCICGLLADLVAQLPDCTKLFGDLLLEHMRLWQCGLSGHICTGGCTLHLLGLTAHWQVEILI